MAHSAPVLTCDPEMLRVIICSHRITLVTLEQKISACKDRRQTAPLTEVYLETKAVLEILEKFKEDCINFNSKQASNS